MTVVTQILSQLEFGDLSAVEKIRGVHPDTMVRRSVQSGDFQRTHQRRTACSRAATQAVRSRRPEPADNALARPVLPRPNGRKQAAASRLLVPGMQLMLVTASEIGPFVGIEAAATLLEDVM